MKLILDFSLHEVANLLSSCRATVRQMEAWRTDTTFPEEEAHIANTIEAMESIISKVKTEIHNAKVRKARGIETN